MSEIGFESYPKVSRLRRDVIITEKIDGTNAQVYITETGQILAGNRNRWITPEEDNFGFARWVEGHAFELLGLGPGRHFGEWYGAGIQRGYGLKEKRFALFNVGRWADPEVRPECCSVVPVIAEGMLCDDMVEDALDQLRSYGSFAAPGYRNPEGIVVYHTASRSAFKVTLENDELPKGLAA